MHPRPGFYISKALQPPPSLTSATDQPTTQAILSQSPPSLAPSECPCIKRAGCDVQLCPFPEPIDLRGEVGGEKG